MVQTASDSPRHLKTALAVVLTAIVVAALMLWLRPLSEAVGETPAHADTDQVTVAPKPLFLTLEPFTVNLQDDAMGGRLLYVAITVQLGDKAAETFLQQHMPQVRNRLLQVLSGQHANTLITGKGKQTLATAIRQALIDAPFAEDADPLDVERVLFTQFIVQ